MFGSNLLHFFFFSVLVKIVGLIVWVSFWVPLYLFVGIFILFVYVAIWIPLLLVCSGIDSIRNKKCQVTWDDIETDWESFLSFLDFFRHPLTVIFSREQFYR